MTPIHSCLDAAALYVRLIASSCACDGKLPEISLVNQTLMTVFWTIPGRLPMQEILVDLSIK
jgi:hypothetical protein